MRKLNFFWYENKIELFKPINKKNVFFHFSDGVFGQAGPQWNVTLADVFSAGIPESTPLGINPLI